MKEKQIIFRYLVGTFSLTYLMWWSIIIANQFGYLKFGTIAFCIVYAIGGLASTIMGAILSKKANKFKSYITLVKEVFLVKQTIKYYALVLLFFAVSFGLPALRNEIQSRMNWYFGILLIFEMIFFGGLEEIGWRYTFQPELERYLPFFVASSITAFFWSLWHLPLFFMEGMNKGMNFGLFAMGVFGMAFMLGAIYRVSKSIWLCVLFHAMINAFSQVWASSVSIRSPFVSTCISTTVKIAMAVIVVELHNRIIKTRETIDKTNYINFNKTN